jgi:hypothetical protein
MFVCPLVRRDDLKAAGDELREMGVGLNAVEALARKRKSAGRYGRRAGWCAGVVHAAGVDALSTVTATQILHR